MNFKFLIPFSFSLFLVGCASNQSMVRIRYNPGATPLVPTPAHEVPFHGDELRTALGSTEQASSLSYDAEVFRSYNKNDVLTDPYTPYVDVSVNEDEAPLKEFSPPSQKQALNPVSDRLQSTLPAPEVPARLIYLPGRKQGSITKDSTRMLVSSGDAGWSPEVFNNNPSNKVKTERHKSLGFKGDPYFQKQELINKPVFAANPKSIETNEEIVEEFIDFGVMGVTAADRMEAFRNVPAYPGGRIAYVEGKGWGVFIK